MQIKGDIFICSDCSNQRGGEAEKFIAQRYQGDDWI